MVIPARNAEATLAQQLAALADQSYEGRWEVVVADNGSSDRTREVAHAWAHRLPCLRVVDASARVGGAHARNVGVAAAGGDFVAFCDADDEIAPGWLTALAAAAPEADMLGGPLDESTLNMPSHRPRGETGHADGLPVRLGFLPIAPSSNCGIWRDVLEAVGGWNERYRRCVDVELSWRVQLASYRLRYVPDAIERYRLPRSGPAIVRQSFGWGRAETQLYRDFRCHGLVRSRGREALRDWKGLARRLPRVLRSPEGRAPWLRLAGHRAGHLWGSIVNRVLFP